MRERDREIQTGQGTGGNTSCYTVLKGETTLHREIVRWTGFKKLNKMIGVLGQGSALKYYTGPGSTWANEMNFVMVMLRNR